LGQGLLGSKHNILNKIDLLSGELTMKTLIIIPAYNEQANISLLLEKLLILKYNKVDIVVINDHSNDNTSAICKSYNVSLIDLPCNLGIGGAVQTGYKYAQYNSYDYAVQVDGDGQHNPEYIANMIEILMQGKVDMIIGSRFLETEGFKSTSLRRVGIIFFRKLIQLCIKQHITDPTSGFRACNQKVINLFAQRYPKDYPEPESIVFLNRHKLLIKEIPVIMNQRMGGVSSINPTKSIYYMIKVSLAILIDYLRKETV
jgi:glycosyltransferase involved in cell wall biosynthesis